MKGICCTKYASKRFLPLPVIVNLVPPAKLPFRGTTFVTTAKIKIKIKM